jgi:ribose transport system ATP-binding protein
LSAIIEFRGIGKQFPGIRALENVSFSIEKGEIHAVVGENGAGKSTLMNILGGQYHPDSGQIYYHGIFVRIQNQFEALKLGIGIVYQELRLCPNLTVTENIFLGREREIGKGKVKWSLMKKKAESILRELGSDIDPNQRVTCLSIANQQIVEIARAISMNAEVLVMDEPTSALTLRETDGLFRNITSLNSLGVTIIYISHRLEEIFMIADRISVLRDGMYLGTYDTGSISQQDLIGLIAGKELSQLISESFTPSRDIAHGVALEVRDLSRPGWFSNISFVLHEQEILGIYGLQGSGRTELLETIFGLAPSWSGEIIIFQKKIFNRNPTDAIRNGLAMIPENRRDTGIFPQMNIIENMNTANPHQMSGIFGVLKRKFMNRLADEMIDSFSIKTSSKWNKVKNLSGGNQQKVVISKWLAAHPRILLIDELTRGIDVGAKAEIYKILKGLRDEGLSIIMVSSELAEVISESDRVLIMKNGSLVKILENGEITRERVIEYAL